MATYSTMFGTVQFPPTDRKVNNQDILSITMRTGTKKVNVTLWPELVKAGKGIKEGDVIVVDGKTETRNVNGTEYINVSATGIAVIGTLEKSQPPTTKGRRPSVVEDEDWA